MSRLHLELQRMWSGERGTSSLILATVTAPLAVLLGGAVRTRNLLYDMGILPSSRAPIPVVSVGNLAVGGTGKTPISAWVAGVLRSAGLKPAILLRGYGEDEILLHRRWNADVPVLRAADRTRGVSTAAEQGCDVVVLDDGFQHRRLRRDLDLLLLSPAHPVPVRLLPRGPFREPLAAIGRAHRILVTAKGTHEMEAARALAGQLREIPGAPPVELFAFLPGDWAALDGSPSAPQAGEPFVVASVAEPAGFVRLVAERIGGNPTRRLLFRDHHEFTRTDATRISRAVGGGWMAVTEKDAVKLLPLREFLPEVRVLPLVPVPPSDLAGTILNEVLPHGTRAGAR
ncbi:MAG: hypothetical protein EXR92_06260 [Gemmatimonadetes bacterium]|nr:hypothetical protein [Gemmatimonadota bacterium]